MQHIITHAFSDLMMIGDLDSLFARNSYQCDAIDHLPLPWYIGSRYWTGGDFETRVYRKGMSVSDLNLPHAGFNLTVGRHTLAVIHDESFATYISGFESNYMIASRLPKLCQLKWDDVYCSWRVHDTNDTDHYVWLPKIQAERLYWRPRGPIGTHDVTDWPANCIMIDDRLGHLISRKPRKIRITSDGQLERLTLEGRFSATLYLRAARWVDLACYDGIDLLTIWVEDSPRLDFVRHGLSENLGPKKVIIETRESCLIDAPLWLQFERKIW